MAAHQVPRPWDSPGKNTGVGFHFPLQYIKVKSEKEIAQSCPTHSGLMDFSLPSSSVHGIFQARVLKWVAIAFSSGSDHQLLIAKSRLKLKRVGKTTRPFRYDLNQIPYDYTVEVMNRFKKLDLVDKVPEELWTEVHNFIQETVTKTILKKKKCKKAKWLSEEALQIAEK